MRTYRRPLALVVLFLLAPALADFSVHATTYLVRPDGSGDFPTIQAAIDAAVAGDVVELGNGTFLGPSNHDVDFLGKSITVQSQSGDPGACVIDCQGSPGEPHRAFRFHTGESATAEVRGLTIVNGYEENGGAIRCTSSASPAITNCIFLGNRSEGDGGALHCDNNSAAAISECWFLENHAGAGGGGLGACSNIEGTPVLTRCTFVGNSADYGGGVYV
jgi:predicted outer membrane repeat protein